MSNSKLPERASLEYLRKLAKERLRELRRSDPQAKLAHAQLTVARDHGFASWRALKSEVEARRSRDANAFFEACAAGDLGAIEPLVASDPDLVRARTERSPFGLGGGGMGATGLHLAAIEGHLNVVQWLLAHGADPNARDIGDNATPLHFAAQNGAIDVARALLDAGSDVHGVGDVHQSEVIGWVTALAAPKLQPEMLELLLQRGARHHVFSAIAVGDPALIKKLVEDDPATLDRRMSHFERGQTPLHFAMSLERYDLLDLLIDLGADLEAQDGTGHTALATAMFRGDREAVNRLRAAGAEEPPAIDEADFGARLAALASSITDQNIMIKVPDVEEALAWYVSIGFTETGRNVDDGLVNWGAVSFGKSRLMFDMGGKRGDQPLSLWFGSDRIEELYALHRARQLQLAQAALAGKPVNAIEVHSLTELYAPFYGGREFYIRDLNGYSLCFADRPAT